MDSIIEVQRQTHEDIEKLQRALSTVLSTSSSSQQSKLAQEYKASQLLDRLLGRVASLKVSYEEDARKAEIDALTPIGQADDLTGFYTRLEKIRQYHRKYPETVVGGLELELTTLLEDDTAEDQGEDEERENPLALLFSGEEDYGRYVDLYMHHSAYNNLSHIDKRLGYLQYLDALIAAKDGLVHSELSKEARCSSQYESYISALHAYLLSFLKRTQPLTDVQEQQREAEAEFNKLWVEQELQGWEAQPQIQKNSGVADTHLWCDACQKQYSKQTVYDAHLKSKKHVKLASRITNGSPSHPKLEGPNGRHTGKESSSKSRLRFPALLTFLTTSLLAGLEPILQDTKSNVERRFSLTAREREAELTEKPTAPPPKPNAEEGAEDEEADERIYNPLKLPLGWDGKPIPYWLYKLHGLGVEYRCEICSDHVYMGRKNFDRHFQESRHAFGMRALGLPNTKHFHEITRIEDALSLAEKLKQEGKHEIFQQETMEELEDDEGNVYNRKTYEDLKKQGLI